MNCILNIVLLIACVFLCVNRQVGQSNRPTFRPGLEGGSSEDEASSGRGGASSSGIGHRRSAEGQVINPPVTGITPIFNVCCVCSSSSDKTVIPQSRHIVKPAVDYVKMRNKFPERLV